MKRPFSFMDNADEWHSFVIGYFEGLCLFIPAQFGTIKADKMVDSEYWYYRFGTGIGFICVLLIGVGIAKLVTVIF